MQLDKKLALVTGGVGGLGKAIARKFIAEGAKVVITDIDDAEGNAYAQEIGATFIHHDVSLEDDWLRVSQQLEALGGLDILVNNAAILRADNIESETLDGFRRIMAVNCDSVFLGIKHCLPLMKHRNSSIINISSSSAMMGYPQFCAYTASKSAVRSLTMSTAVYSKQQGLGVRCNSIHPDGIVTPMVMNIAGTPPEFSDEQARHAASFACLPEAIADVVLFLASSASRHMNGAALSVDNTSTIHPPYH